MKRFTDGRARSVAPAGRNAPPRNTWHELRALGLRDAELDDLEHFLRALSGEPTP